MAKAKHDRLLAALIARLPVEIAQWPRADRMAWLQMIAMAFDVVYGPCGGIRVVLQEARIDEEDHSANAPRQVSAAHHVTAQAAASTAQRFYVDRDGFAMGDGKPIAMEELPPGAILWDERVGIECGDAAAILWRDIGTSRRSLPPSVILRPVFDES
jgi:hypothetical protein